MDTVLTPTLVDEYLATLRPDEIAGMRRTHRDCPLARSLARVTGHAASINRQEWVSGQTRGWTPLWAQMFIARVDRTRGPITARGARRLLRHVIDGGG